MATDDQQVLVAGTAPAPASFTIPGNGQIRPKAVRAVYDGTAAATFIPVLRIISDAGVIVSEAPGPTIAAGGSADVSWFPSVGGLRPGAAQGLRGARLQATSVQSVPNSTNTDLHYQSVLFDTDGMADLVADNRVLTVQTAGLYLVICSTVWAYNSAGRRINTALHNGFYSVGGIPDVDSQSSNSNAIWTGNGRSVNSCTGVYQADVGDFFSSGAFQGSGAALNANGFGNCFLSALLIGTT